MKPHIVGYVSVGPASQPRKLEFSVPLKNGSARFFHLFHFSFLISHFSFFISLFSFFIFFFHFKRFIDVFRIENAIVWEGEWERDLPLPFDLEVKVVDPSFLEKARSVFLLLKEIDESFFSSSLLSRLSPSPSPSFENQEESRDSIGGVTPQMTSSEILESVVSGSSSSGDVDGLVKEVVENVFSNIGVGGERRGGEEEIGGIRSLKRETNLEKEEKERKEEKRGGKFMNQKKSQIAITKAIQPLREFFMEMALSPLFSSRQTGTLDASVNVFESQTNLFDERERKKRVIQVVRLGHEKHQLSFHFNIESLFDLTKLFSFFKIENKFI